MAKKRVGKLGSFYMEFEGLEEAEELVEVGKWQMLQALAMEGGAKATGEFLRNGQFSTGDWKEVKRTGNDWDVYSNKPSTVRRILGTKPHVIPANPILSNYYNPYRAGSISTFGHNIFFSKTDVMHPGSPPDREVVKIWESAPRVGMDAIGLIYTSRGNIQSRTRGGTFGRNI